MIKEELMTENTRGLGDREREGGRRVHRYNNNTPMPYDIYSPVHTPVAFSSSPLTHVFPEPGKLARATAALLVPLIKWQGPGLAPPTLLQMGR